MNLETIGKVLTSGFSDRVLMGFITGALEDVTPMIAYEHIRDNTQLLHWASDSDWQKLRRMAKDTDIPDITSEDIIKELRKHRLDILGVIINTDGGRDWLDTQIAELKKKLLD